ncbi:symmetrical bis(5'-nucleosyl)-tetraphosphatase [Psychrosphaera ytuae]|uniref:bis(5'-nucleosyl)-tetraphosphatase (symmetrical) n=1 Tax=Psychrosphaera ytuae TaxID=2820710 RepID=A0A975DC86_9GAMM|nr:symmetrical bis(5'-nucleosyl)-tetraphosphatase [Psychrosphaera ytuae]QTH63671.1 symmetrical bis(5'-nucleosyl)-tetraphosphatase [Psychrosphaera ytuae]
MADYFIGDIQGCFAGLQKALATVQFEHGRDTLWLTGDLIARGDDSLSTLSFLADHESSVRTVLGNHDLHFLAVANGLKNVNPKDNLQPLIDSARLPYFRDWLRAQPLLLALPDESGFMSHAGLPPLWSPKKAKKWASILQESLRSADYRQFLSEMYGNKPVKWDKNLTRQEKITFSVNAFTRMRFCTKSGELDFSNKSSPKSSEANSLIPWFEFEPERFDTTKWVFGHWAALMGETQNPNVIGLDTGFVWGNYLTIMHWQNHQKIQISA